LFSGIIYPHFPVVEDLSPHWVDHGKAKNIRLGENFSKKRANRPLFDGQLARQK
jgi:hypothetical protein